MLYVANWKMFLSYNESLAWATAHGVQLAQLAKNATIVICPEASALAQIRQRLDSRIAVGAQNCAAQKEGAYTGELSPLSLQEIGITYCIIGHSERRASANETSEQVAQKAVLLLKHNITPIVCFSGAIGAELAPVFIALAAANNKKPIVIAYEPLDAIGSGTAASNQQILQVLIETQEKIANLLPDTPVSLLYGGSVNPENIQELKSLPILDGFLIGKASTDFDKLKQIMELK